MHAPLTDVNDTWVSVFESFLRHKLEIFGTRVLLVTAGIRTTNNSSIFIFILFFFNFNIIDRVLSGIKDLDTLKKKEITAQQQK